MRTYEIEQPWVVYEYLTHDRFWPPWNSTRFLGRAYIACECAVCGHREVLNLRIPRFGKVPEPAKDKHHERIRFLSEHVHPERGDPMSWAKPLLNPEAHESGLDIEKIADLLQERTNTIKRFVDLSERLDRVEDNFGVMRDRVESALEALKTLVPQDAIPQAIYDLEMALYGKSSGSKGNG